MMALLRQGSQDGSANHPFIVGHKDDGRYLLGILWLEIVGGELTTTLHV
jgi:hypothetical protein